MKHNYLTEYGHVKLRPLLESDIEPLRLLRNRFRCYFINNEEIATDQQKTWFARYLEKQNDIMFSICCPSMEFAGAIALYDIDFKASYAEFGRIVVSEGAPKQTGTYAIEALLLFARDVLHLTHISCSVLSGNIRAKTIYERLGFLKLSEVEGLVYYQIDLSTFCLVS